MVYRQLLFKFVSVLSLVIAIYHLVGIFYQLDQSPPWRHAVFVIICLFCYYSFVKRPKYFVYFFLALTAQQFYSHGGYFISQWFHYNKVDWISLLLLVLFPIILINLIFDLKSKNT